MREVDRVRDSVVERCRSIFEQGHHLGVDRSEDDQPTPHLIRLCRQSIYTCLQVRAKLLIALAIEVLELIEDQYEATFSHRLQELRQLQQASGTWILTSGNMKRFQGVVHRRQNASRLGIGNLHVKDRLVALDLFHGPLDQGRLADSAAPRHLGEEPASTGEHPL